MPSHPAAEPPRPAAAEVVSLRGHLVRDFVLIGVGLVAVMAALTFLLTGRMVEVVEQRETKRVWERIAAVEKAEADLLRTLVDDYAYRNEMADFAQSGAAGFPASAFDTWFFDNSDTDAVLVLSPDDAVMAAIVTGRAAASIGVSSQAPPAFAGANGLLAMPPPLVERLRTLPENTVVRVASSSGLTWLPWNGRWMQVAIAATGRRGEAPNGGLILLLRVVDEERLASRAIQTQLAYRIVAYDAAAPAVQAAGNSARLAVPLADAILGTGAMAVARHPYELSALLQRVQALTLLQQSLLLAALIFLLIGLLSHRVIDRVQALRRDVEALRHGATRRAELPGPRDELALLGEDFDAVLRALDSARSEWRQAALRDPLTGLGNRAALQGRLQLQLSAGRRWPATLYLLDLDGFKAINDVHGHATGDALLVALGCCLVDRLGERAEVFRLGGDEYAIVVHDDGDIGNEVLAAIAEVSVADSQGQPLRSFASLGWAGLQEGVDSPGDWLRRADIAMYEAKRAGGRCVVEYVPSMRESLLERESIERRLRRALDEASIEVAFQPIVAARDGQLLAVEALARWHDPERGRVPPSRFVPVAEEAGFSAELDLMALEKALPVVIALRALVPDVVLQTNLAPASLLSPGLVERVHALVRAVALPPSALLLEVTEGALAADPVAAVAVVTRLREIGLRIALDDFGAGYSSLARLAELKPAALKIDGQFVRDFDGAGDRIIRSILGLARAFGLHTTAEFVETERQCEYLRSVGCDALQGYGIAEPMPADAMLAWAELSMRSRPAFFAR